MPKSVWVILADGFEEIEAAAPIDILRRAGLDVTVAGLDKRSVTSARALTVVADSEFKDLKGLPDALVLPGGGKGAENLAASEPLKKLLSEMNASDRVIGAICASPAVVLSHAGVLKGRRATGYPGMEDQAAPGVRFVNERLVTDGTVTTSQGPGTAVEFSLELVRRLCGDAAVKGLKEKMVIST